MYIFCQLLEQFSGSQAAYGTIVRVTGSYQKAGISYLEEGYWKDFHNY
jgi:hypothetical protein